MCVSVSVLRGEVGGNAVSSESSGVTRRVKCAKKASACVGGQKVLVSRTRSALSLWLNLDSHRSPSLVHTLCDPGQPCGELATLRIHPIAHQTDLDNLGGTRLLQQAHPQRTGVDPCALLPKVLRRECSPSFRDIAESLAETDCEDCRDSARNATPSRKTTGCARRSRWRLSAKSAAKPSARISRSTKSRTSSAHTATTITSVPPAQALAAAKPLLTTNIVGLGMTGD